MTSSGQPTDQGPLFYLVRPLAIQLACANGQAYLIMKDLREFTNGALGVGSICNDLF